MLSYEGFTENDLNVIQIAVKRLQITGEQAPMITALMKKLKWRLIYLIYLRVNDHKKVMSSQRLKFSAK